MEDEDPTPASSTPPPIAMDSFRTTSPLVCPQNRDPDDDGDDLDDDDDAGEDEEEKAEEVERRDRDSSHSPSPVASLTSPGPALAVGASKPKPTPQSATPAASGREDCWSEDATWVLIEAWGERHLRAQAEPQSHQRGGLRQKDWEEVAEAVASRGDEGKPAKSEGQCKNRIDTLKKKYKVERLKPHSSWLYFSRLNDLLAADYEEGGGHGNGSSSKLPVGVGFGSFRHQLQQLQMKKKKRTTKKRSHRQLLQSVKPPPFLSPSPPIQGKEEDSSDGLPPTNGKSGKKTGRKGLPLVGLGPGPTRLPLATKGGARPEAGLRELAHAVMRLSEIYERVESTKLRQAEELEKRRMGLAKELEVQRMDFFMKTLVEVNQSNPKKSKRQPTPDATENHTAAAQVEAAAGGHSNKSSRDGVNH